MTISEAGVWLGPQVATGLGMKDGRKEEPIGLGCLHQRGCHPWADSFQRRAGLLQNRTVLSSAGCR